MRTIPYSQPRTGAYVTRDTDGWYICYRDRCVSKHFATQDAASDCWRDGDYTIPDIPAVEINDRAEDNQE